MSWNKGFSAVKKSELVETLRSATYNIGEVGYESMLEQVEAARVAVFSLVASGALGSEEDAMFNINLSGHGNPDHAQTPGWANDCISISISRYYE